MIVFKIIMWFVLINVAAAAIYYLFYGLLMCGAYIFVFVDSYVQKGKKWLNCLIEKVLFGKRNKDKNWEF